MSLPRRRLIRPEVRAATPSGQQHKIQKLRSRTDQERERLKKWMTRLRRAFHAVEKQQQLLARLERQITKLQGE